MEYNGCRYIPFHYMTKLKGVFFILSDQALEKHTPMCYNVYNIV